MTRWLIRQGLVSFFLQLLGLLSIVAAAVMVWLPLGLVVLGLSCFILEDLVREDHL